jgi:hypothetical protein
VTPSSLADVSEVYCKITRRHTPADRNLHVHRQEILKCKMIFIYFSQSICLVLKEEQADVYYHRVRMSGRPNNVWPS